MNRGGRGKALRMAMAAIGLLVLTALFAPVASAEEAIYSAKRTVAVPPAKPPSPGAWDS